MNAMMMAIGDEVVAGIQRGFAFMFFPVMTKQGDRVVPSLGKAVIPLLTKGDVDRLVSVAVAIGKANDEVIERIRQQGEVAHLAAQRDAERVKDNATRDAVAMTNGQAGGIVIASH